MKRAQIIRLNSTVEHGTPGIFRWEDSAVPECLTLEDPWLDNTPFVSCIPAGRYICQYWRSPTHGWTYQVMDVLNRTYILFHIGNTDDDTEGCILVGSRYGTLRSGKGVVASAVAWSRLFPQMREAGDQWELDILWAGVPPKLTDNPTVLAA